MVRQRQIGDALLQGTRFTAQVLHITAGCSTYYAAGKPALASFQKLLRPSEIQALRNAFLAAQLGNTLAFFSSVFLFPFALLLDQAASWNLTPIFSTSSAKSHVGRQVTPIHLS